MIGQNMSGKEGNAFTNPSSGKIDQQRKILEELEKRKKQLNQGGQPTSSSAVGMSVQNTLPNVNNSNNSGTPNSTNPIESPHMLSTTQRQAMEVANKTSFGNFIPQDSSFGNLILPVIPRINPNQVQQQ